VLMRVRPTSVEETAIYHITLYRRGESDTFLARSGDARFQGPPYVSLGEEGLVYREQSSTQFLNPLRLFRNASTGDLVSTTASEAEMGRSGYVLVLESNLIGWVAPLH
jgi:hypothetical protein